MKLRQAGAFWKDEVLALPRALMEAYHARLAGLALPSAFADRSKRFGLNHVGGASDAETTAHFAMNFAGGAARPLFVYLDPRDRFVTAGETLRALLYDGRVCVVDAPCGAGAASLTLLTAVAHLREQAILPTTPLDVHVLHADIAPLALRLAEQSLDDLRSRLASVGVEVTNDSTIWDVSSQDDVQALARRAGDAKMPLVLILVGAFSEAFKHDWHLNYTWLASALAAQRIPCALVWVEAAPEDSKKYKGFEWLTKFARTLDDLGRRVGLFASGPAAARDTFSAIDPVEPTAQAFKANVAAHTFFNNVWRS